MDSESRLLGGAAGLLASRPLSSSPAEDGLTLTGPSTLDELPPRPSSRADAANAGGYGPRGVWRAPADDGDSALDAVDGETYVPFGVVLVDGPEDESLMGSYGIHCGWGRCER